MLAFEEAVMACAGADPAPALTRPIIGPAKQYRRRPERTDAILLDLIAVVFVAIMVALFVLGTGYGE
jgi:hypothetical protein